MYKDIDFFSKQDEYYSCSRSEMIKYIPDSARKVLEVGCGKGYFGKTLKSLRDVEIWGVEVCQGAAVSAMQNLDKVIVGDIERGSLDLPEHYFDCIIFNDVLEHFVNPWGVLKTATKYLRNDGHIVASIPNVRYIDNIEELLQKKEWKYRDEGILDKTHLRFFTEKSIRRMFESCGFSVITLEGINASKTSWVFKLLNWLTKYNLNDMRYLQFACVARTSDANSARQCHARNNAVIIIKKQIKIFLKRIISENQVKALRRAYFYLQNRYIAKSLNTYRYRLENISSLYDNIHRPHKCNEKVSIVIPTLSKNGQADHLLKLRKLLSDYLPNQRYDNYEAIVYCDGPNMMVKDMILSLNDSRVKFFHTDSTIGLWGHPQTRMGIVAGSGSFFVRMNDDNKPSKNYLETLISGFDHDIGIVYGRVVYKGEARNVHYTSLETSFIIPGDRNGTLREKNIDCMNYMVRMNLAKAYVKCWNDSYSADWFFIEALLRDGIKTRFRNVIIGEKF